MPAAGIFPASLAILSPSSQSLSSCWAITGPGFFQPLSILSFSIASAGYLFSPAIIRMGGGPRTFPGGVSKWQWKRMQAKKARQLLKARLCRERQLYEMRKRAELKAAISELERPWEVVKRTPVLLSATADEQVKVLADRFQRPSGFDMWSEKDGPQLFLSSDDLPSARFFPKGTVHSLKPYSIVSGKIPDGSGDSDEGDGEMRYDDWIARGAGGIGRGRRVRRVLSDSSLTETVMLNLGKSGDGDTVEDQISYSSDSELQVAEPRGKKERAELLNRNVRNYGPHESDVAALTMKGDEMVAEFSRDDGRSSVSNLSDSELALTDLRMEGHEMVGGFRVRGEQVSRGGYRVSYGSHSELPAASSRVLGDEMDRGFDQRHRDSSMDEQKLPNDIYRLGGGVSRGGHRIGNGNRGSLRSYSTLPVAGLRREGDMKVGNFGRRRGHRRNQVSQFSNSKFGVVGSRMDDRRMDESFSPRVRSGHGGYQSSYMSYSDLAVDDNSRIDIGITEDFGYRNVNHSWSRDPPYSDSEQSVARWRAKEDEIFGGVDRRHSRGSHFQNRGVARSRGFGRGSGRGGYRGSYGSNSGLIIAGSRKVREMGMTMGSVGQIKLTRLEKGGLGRRG